MTESRSSDTSQLLREATQDLAPDVDRLVAGGVARGHTLRRRRRITTTLVAAAVVGVIGTAASVAPGLLDDGDAGGGTPVATDDATSGDPQPSRRPSDGSIDALITVAAEDFPTVVAERLPDLDVGEIREDATTPLVDERQQKIAFFEVEGTLASVQIVRADSVATCEQQATQSDDLRCEMVDGVELWTYGPATGDGVTYQSVTATVHGFNVTADSYNAADGKGVPIVTEVPPVSIEQLTALVTDGVWFAEPETAVLVAAGDLPDVVTSVVPGEVVEAQRLGGYFQSGKVRLAHFTLDGAVVSAILEPFDGDSAAAEKDCRRAGLECRTLEDGAVLGRGSATAPAADGGYSNRVVMAWLPGYVASVLSYNAGDLSTGEIVRPEPLDFDLLEQVVLADGWLSAP